MLGAHGYGTNAYGSRRPVGIVGPLVHLAMRVLQSGYGVVNVLLLKFRRTTLIDPSGNINNTLQL